MAITEAREVKMQEKVENDAKAEIETLATTEIVQEATTGDKEVNKEHEVEAQCSSNFGKTEGNAFEKHIYENQLWESSNNECNNSAM